MLGLTPSTPPCRFYRQQAAVSNHQLQRLGSNTLQQRDANGSSGSGANADPILGLGPWLQCVLVVIGCNAAVAALALLLAPVALQWLLLSVLLPASSQQAFEGVEGVGGVGEVLAKLVATLPGAAGLQDTLSRAPAAGGEHPASIHAFAAALAAAAVCCLQGMACLVARWLIHHMLHSRIPGHDHTRAAATGGKGDASNVARSPHGEAIAAASTRLRVVKLSLAAACLSGLACINWALALALSLSLLLVAWVGWAARLEGGMQEGLYIAAESLGLARQAEVTGAEGGTGEAQASPALGRTEGLVAGVQEQQVEGAAGEQVAGTRMRSLALGLPRRAALLLLSPAVLAGLAWVLAAELGQEPHPVQVVGSVCKGSALTALDLVLDLAALRADALLGVMLWGLAVPFWALTWAL